MASSLRQRKIADSIKQELGRVISMEIRDPDKGFVTITNARVTADLSIAYIYISVVGEDGQEEKSIAVLEKAAGFLRTAIAKALKTKKVPALKFFIDDTLDYMNSMGQIVKQIKSETTDSEDSAKDDEESQA